MYKPSWHLFPSPGLTTCPPTFHTFDGNVWPGGVYTYGRQGGLKYTYKFENKPLNWLKRPVVLVGFHSRGGRVFYRNNGDTASNKKDEKHRNTIIYCNVVCWVKLVSHIDSWLTWIVLRLPLNPPCVDKGCICRIKKSGWWKKRLKN